MSVDLASKHYLSRKFYANFFIFLDFFLPLIMTNVFDTLELYRRREANTFLYSNRLKVFLNKCDTCDTVQLKNSRRLLQE